MVTPPDARRLSAGEEEALLRASGPYLTCVIIDGPTTGVRIGERLSLQWSQVERDAHDTPVRLRLTADKTKTSRVRVLPIEPLRLRSRK